MKLKGITLIAAALVLAADLCAQSPIPRNASEDKEGIMSEAYWAMWNQDEQKRIDGDIERYRKADAELKLEGVKKGSKVKVEQVGHSFFFGAQIFNFNQLGSTEKNLKYKEVFGTLFNRATVPFYWRHFEMQPDRPRFREEYWDTEEFWNRQTNPYSQPHWRRPSTDQIIEFCESRGVAVHGHTIIWGTKIEYPEWIVDEKMVPEEKALMMDLIESRDTPYPDTLRFRYSDVYDSMSVSDLEKAFPRFAMTLDTLYAKRIKELADYYGSRVGSWDVVNESAADWVLGEVPAGAKLCKSSRYGILQGDYVYKSFKTAEKVFPEGVKLNINDYRIDPLPGQVKELISRGARVDVIGTQMHIFDPQESRRIAMGSEVHGPEMERRHMETLSGAGVPLHLSEITIAAPGTDERSRMIQAVIARNLYRLWFSQEMMTGITWWNLVDDGSLGSEPVTSGIFTRDMELKPVFYALDELINHEWKTSLVLTPAKDGKISFRGFRGKYKITYTDKKGRERVIEYELK